MSKRKLYLPSQVQIKARYEQAYLDLDSPTGKYWYQIQNLVLADMAIEFNVPIKLVAEVVAVLSPSLRWPMNIPSARRIFEAIASGANIFDLVELFKTISGYNVNKVKAVLMIVTGSDVWFSGPKVTAFAKNLINPFSVVATIDRHMLRLALFDFTMTDDDLSKYSKPDIIEYFAAPLRELANELGLYVAELQAYLWVASQEISAVVRKTLGLRVYTVETNLSF